MKNFKQTLFLLLAGVIFSFSACNDSEEPFELIEEPGFYSINTINPVIGEDNIVFKGKLTTADTQVTYGFMWYEIPVGDQEADVTTVPVGAGAMNGEFSIVMTGLPKGKNLIVCAYVEYQLGTELASEIGEELEFGWD